MIDKKRVASWGRCFAFAIWKLGNLKLFKSINTKVRCEGMFCFVIPLGVLGIL
jgi:hypothetical protein